MYTWDPSTHHLIASSSSPPRFFIRQIAHPTSDNTTSPTATLIPTMAEVEMLALLEEPEELEPEELAPAEAVALAPSVYTRVTTEVWPEALVVTVV